MITRKSFLHGAALGVAGLCSTSLSGWPSAFGDESILLSDELVQEMAENVALSLAGVSVCQ